MDSTLLDFDGITYRREHDAPRLNAQLARVHDVMRSARWYTLAELSDLTGDPPASISARIRDLRKSRFGNHTVERRRRGEAPRGIWEYRLGD